MSEVKRLFLEAGYPEESLVQEAILRDIVEELGKMSHWVSPEENEEE